MFLDIERKRKLRWDAISHMCEMMTEVYKGAVQMNYSTEMAKALGYDKPVPEMLSDDRIEIFEDDPSILLDFDHEDKDGNIFYIGLGGGDGSLPILVVLAEERDDWFAYAGE